MARRHPGLQTSPLRSPGEIGDFRFAEPPPKVRSQKYRSTRRCPVQQRNTAKSSRVIPDVPTRLPGRRPRRARFHRGNSGNRNSEETRPLQRNTVPRCAETSMMRAWLLMPRITPFMLATNGPVRRSQLVTSRRRWLKAWSYSGKKMS